MKTSFLRPGILVALKSSVAGGVSYQRVDLEKGTADDGSSRARWETTRTLSDADEHERAAKARSAACYQIRTMCAKTNFGLLCPEAFEGKLDEAIAAAQRIADEHNASAKFSCVQVFALKGRVAADDEQAARAIASEVGELLTEMRRAVDSLDPKAIREAVARTRQIGTMLTGDQAQKVSAALESARDAAKTIVKRVKEKGELAAVVLQDLKLEAIEDARMTFLDFDTPAPAPSEDALPAVAVQRFADLGDVIDDAIASQVANDAVPARAIEVQ